MPKWIFTRRALFKGDAQPPLKVKCMIQPAMPEQPVETQTLPNYTTLACYDRSRRLAGDRWKVTLEVHVSIPVDRRTLPDSVCEAAVLEAMREALGDPYHHIDLQERIFVSEAEKQCVLDGFLAAMRRKAIYFAHPDFPRRCLLKAFQEIKRKRDWYRQS